MTAKGTFYDRFLRTLLSADTASSRKHLLLTSVIAVSITQGGLLPTKVESLGMELDTENLRVLLVLTGSVVAYWFGSFLLFATADLTRNRLLLTESELNMWSKAKVRRGTEADADDLPFDPSKDLLAQAFQREIIGSILQETSDRFEHLHDRAVHLRRIRIGWELLLPILVGLYSLTSTTLAVVR